MNWLQKIASDEYYEALVLDALKMLGGLKLNDAMTEIQKKGPHGLDLWVLFKDKFQENPHKFMQWLETRRLQTPRYEGMDEIDEWAKNTRQQFGWRSGTPYKDIDPKIPTPELRPQTGGPGSSRRSRQRRVS